MRAGATLWSHLRAFARSASASVLSSGAELSTLAGMHAARVPLVVAFALVQLVGTTITFTLNKYWAFGAGDSGRIVAEGGKALAVFGGSFALNTALPSLGTYVVGLSPFVAYAIAQVITYSCWNFPLNRWWVFRSGLHEDARAQDRHLATTTVA